MSSVRQHQHHKALSGTCKPTSPPDMNPGPYNQHALSCLALCMTQGNQNGAQHSRECSQAIPPWAGNGSAVPLMETSGGLSSQLPGTEVGKRKETAKITNIQAVLVTLSINLNLISAYSKVKSDLRIQLWSNYWPVKLKLMQQPRRLMRREAM